MNLKELNKYIRITKFEIYLSVFFFFILLFPFPTGADRFFWAYFFDAGHPVLFFLCTLLLKKIYVPDSTKSKRRVIIETGTMSFLIASAMELVQPIFGRSASLRDLSLGALGIIPACFMLSPFPVLMVSGAIILFFIESIAFAPASIAMQAIKWRKENFPMLANFENNIQFILIRGTYISQKRNNNSYLKVYQPIDQTYLIRYEAGDKNWSEYKYFNVEILNPLKLNTDIHIRIDDDQDCEEIGTRYTKKIDLSPGWNNVSIPTIEISESPKLRKLNLNKIRYVYFYINEGHEWFGIDNLRLSN